MLEHDIDVGLRCSNARRAVEGRLTLGVKQVATRAPQVIEPDHQVLPGRLAVVHGHAGQVGFGSDQLAGFDHVVPGAGRLQAELFENVSAVKHQLHMAADRETQDVLAVAIAIAGRAQVSVGVARLHVDFLLGQHGVQRFKQLVHRGAPDVHGAQHVVLRALPHQFGGQFFSRAGKRHVLVFHLDAGERLELAQPVLMGLELRGYYGQQVDLGARIGLAGLEGAGVLRHGPGRKGPAHAGRRGLKNFATFHYGLLVG